MAVLAASVGVCADVVPPRAAFAKLAPSLFDEAGVVDARYASLLEAVEEEEEGHAASSLLKLCRELVEYGEMAAAAEMCDRALRICEGPPPTQGSTVDADANPPPPDECAGGRLEADALFYFARAAEAFGRDADAVAMLERAVSIHESDADAHFLLGSILHSR